MSVAIPAPFGIVGEIDKAVERALGELPRPHLGASQIGKECERALWLGFRWAWNRNRFDGRMLRLFERGQREEARFVRWLELAGVTVNAVDPRTGEQFRLSDPDCGGHFGGSMDGACLGLPEAPKTWHVLEFKTHNAKSFAQLAKDGVAKAKPEHFAQMQMYMHWSGLERALYLAVCKDDESLYAERVAYRKEIAERMAERARRIVFAQEPPAGISDDPTWYACKFCDFFELCHGRLEESGGLGPARLPDAHCRTCLHATPEADGEARWTCAKWPDDAGKPSTIPVEGQRQGCPAHRYIPALIPWAAVADASDDGDVLYELKGDARPGDPASEGRASFVNGETAPGEHVPAYSSLELLAIHPAHIGAAEVEALRAKLGARAVAADFDDDDVPF